VHEGTPSLERPQGDQENERALEDGKVGMDIHTPGARKSVAGNEMREKENR
jgi:hypothetical protein